jgi:hypothetical protein
MAAAYQPSREPPLVGDRPHLERHATVLHVDLLLGVPGGHEIAVGFTGLPADGHIHTGQTVQKLARTSAVRTARARSDTAPSP